MDKRGLAVAIGVVLAGMVASSASAGTNRDDSRYLSFGGTSFDPVEVTQRRAPAQTASGAGFRLVQFHETPQSAWRDQLVNSGLVVLQYYPHNAYLVWGDEQAAARVMTMPFVRWQGGFSPDWKRSESLKDKVGTIDNVQVLVFDDGNLASTLQRIRDLGGTVLNMYRAQPDGRLQSVITRIDASRLDGLTLIPQVLWAEYVSPRAYFDDELAAQIIAGNYNGAGQVTGVGYIPFITTLGLSGDNVRWAVTDSGVDYANPELAGRIVAGHDFPGCPTVANQPGDDNSSGGHGTHVAGIVGGAGVVAGGVDANGFHHGIGIAPQVDLVALNPICVGSVPWPPAGGWQELSKRALAAQAIGSNNSWTSGEGAGVGYNASARTHDFMIRDGDFDTTMINEPFIEVFSAGNSGSGPNTITAPKEAKNIIVVGATRNQRVGSIDAMASFSSRGPAIDTRTLPTISAPGEQISSTRRVAGASDCNTAIGAGVLANYAFCSGTSMASPQVAGMSALLAQWWRGNNAGATPSPAMVKALLVNGAVDMATADVPNNNEGWGRVQLPRSLADGLQAEYVDQTELMTNVAAVYERTFGVPSSSAPIRVTLAWTDAPGAAGANPALVNNLDLEVVANGTTYRGNAFNQGLSIPGGTADNRNNVENVFLNPNTASAVTIRVIATALPGDGVPNTGDTTDQDFALVCSNCLEDPTFTVSASQQNFNICSLNTTQISSTISVGSILGFGNTVNLTSTGAPGGSSASFVPPAVNPPGTSVFTVSNLGGAAPGAYPIDVSGNSGGTFRNTVLNLNIATANPGTPTLTAPAAGANNVALRPTFTWGAGSQSAEYVIEIDDTADFSSPIQTATVTGTSHTPTADLPSNTVLNWRVRSSNTCGVTQAAGQSFTTAAQPGDCSIGTVPEVHYTTSFETAPSDWTASVGTAGTATWAINTTRPRTGTNAWLGVDVAAISDQLLTSPQIALPAGQGGLTLSYYSQQFFEDRAGGCFDGTLLEVSTNNGGTWTQVPNADLLTDPYNGPFDTRFGIPLPSAMAWCEDPTDTSLPGTWTRGVVDIGDYAGQSVRFRFRVASDDSVGRAPHGFYLDDVQVQGCAIPDVNAIFRNSFD